LVHWDRVKQLNEWLNPVEGDIGLGSRGKKNSNTLAGLIVRISLYLARSMRKSILRTGLTKVMKEVLLILSSIAQIS
jgi:hypothetical protein